jgi:hypothetical protein
MESNINYIPFYGEVVFHLLHRKSEGKKNERKWWNKFGPGFGTVNIARSLT